MIQNSLNIYHSNKIIFISITIAILSLNIFSVHAQPKTITILDGSDSITNNEFYKPNKITIPKGTTITWQNNDDTDHTVTSNNGKTFFFDSGLIFPNKPFSKQFNIVGIFEYHCQIHWWMNGKIIVTP